MPNKGEKKKQFFTKCVTTKMAYLIDVNGVSVCGKINMRIYGLTAVDTKYLLHFKLNLNLSSLGMKIRL